MEWPTRMEGGSALPTVPGKMQLARIAEIPVGAAQLHGDLSIPDSPCGLVVFAHGSGATRESPGNQRVAGMLNERGFATLLFDLLTAVEEQDRANVFHIGHLGRRLVQATRWARSDPDVGALPLGYFGASTGSAAAFIAAAELKDEVSAIVSRGGRPDLAIHRLRLVTAPTLLIVGSLDVAVLQLNYEASGRLGGPNELVTVPGATQLFEEPGALERVVDLTGDWFARHLAGAGGQIPAR
ncbi:MAG: dienelactone hydrolase family protein [Solirubrobacterales bacterium]